MKASRIWLRWGLPLLVALLPVQGVGAQAHPASERPGSREEALAAFADRLAKDVEVDGLGGISAGVVMGRDLVWGQGFGWADVERGIPAGVNTIYRVGSISKSFTAVALLQLWERGFLQLDDPVAEVLPEFEGILDRPPGAVPVTYRHLASHTAGLIREPELEGATDGPLEFWEEKILASIPTTSYYAPPGTSYRYSNIGFGILGYALSLASGIPFMELVDAGILRPLGMHSSGFVVTPAFAEQLAAGYIRRGDGTIDKDTSYREHVGRGYKVPNGGVYSTVGDLARFVAGLTGSAMTPVLGPEGRELIRISQTPEGDTGYSFGFSLSSRPGSPDLIGHSGSVAGYNAYLVFEADSGIGVVLLRNYVGGETNLGEAARELLWELVEIETTQR